MHGLPPGFQHCSRSGGIIRPFVQIDEIGRVGYTVVFGLHRL